MLDTILLFRSKYACFVCVLSSRTKNTIDYEHFDLTNKVALRVSSLSYTALQNLGSFRWGALQGTL